ncbi:MAG TPA: septation protein SepH [Marmoricola sp.]|nr:septation protein SepH [Marmoricola sp.]
MDSVLRPRDIQARIRAGESPERVAEAAQTPVDRIMAFAAPVLAERAYVAQQAQKASVRRRAGDGPIGQLGDAVASRLAEKDVRADEVEWDAWRREDGRWTLVADFALQGTPHRAQFAYDAAGRYVVAEDDEARALVGERGGAAERTEQLPLGDDAIEVVTGRRPAPPTEEPTVDLTDTAAVVRPPSPFPTRAAQPAADDWISTQATERPPAEPAEPAEAEAEDEAEDEPAAAAEPEALFEASELEPESVEPSLLPAEEQPSDAKPADAKPADEPPAEPPAEPRKRPKAKSKGRASVPSWDEIMFGSGRGEG